jgi:hypothetical protein
MPRRTHRNPSLPMVVSRGMTHPTASRPVVLGLLAVLLLGACSGAAAPASSPGPSDGNPSAGAPSTGSGDVGDGSSGAPGQTDPDTAVGAPVDPVPVDPGVGQAKLVMPRPGQLNPRPVGAALLEPAVDGHHVLIRVTWWSGVEPCNVLDSVKVDRSGTDISIQLIEGSSDLNAMCIELAQQKATIVDLGDLEPGTYTISAGGQGDAVPVTVTVA